MVLCFFAFFARLHFGPNWWSSSCDKTLHRPLRALESTLSTVYVIMIKLLFVFQFEPWQIKTQLENGSFTYTGIVMDIVNALAEFINFK